MERGGGGQPPLAVLGLVFLLCGGHGCIVPQSVQVRARLPPENEGVIALSVWLTWAICVCSGHGDCRGHLCECVPGWTAFPDCSGRKSQFF